MHKKNCEMVQGSSFTDWSMLSKHMCFVKMEMWIIPMILIYW